MPMKQKPQNNMLKKNHQEERNSKNINHNLLSFISVSVKRIDTLSVE